MFIVQFKRIYREGKVRKTIIGWGKDYVWSLCFMSSIVGGMKSALCLSNTLGIQLDGKIYIILGRITPLLSTFASPGLYFLE